MSRTIWKYPLEVTDIQKIRIPLARKYLFVAEQYDRITLWAEVDAAARIITEKIVIHGTGHPVEKDEYYIGTCMQAGGQLVWHVYVKGVAD